MEFVELSNLWNSNNTTLEKSVNLNKALIKNLALGKVKSTLSEVKWGSFFEIGINVLFYFFIVNFIRDNYDDIKFLFPAVLLLIVTIVEFAAEIYNLWLVYSLDAQQSIMDAQRKLVKLKQMEMLDVYSLYILIPLFSAPFFIVISKGLLDINLYQFDLNWLISYMLGSIVVAVVLVFIVRKFPNQKLRNAIEFLKEFEETEKVK